MTDGIAVTPERLREISTQMSLGAIDVQEILSGLSAEIAPVRTEWVGAAQAQFNSLWDQLETDASGLHSALTGIAKLTEGAARAYEAAEASIAKSFDEFRVERDLIHATAGVFDELEELLAESKTQAESTVQTGTTTEAGTTTQTGTTVGAEDTVLTGSTVQGENTVVAEAPVEVVGTVQSVGTEDAGRRRSSRSPTTR
jgi:WXG100 family type VII secretion target